MFKNRVLRGIFGPKRDEIIGDLRKLHNEGLHNFYSSPQVKEDEMDRACSTHGENKNAFIVWARKPQARKSLMRRRRKYENKYHKLFKEIG
jgi:hypothetical protein